MSVGMNDDGDRFRAVNLYASKNGFSGAFPTFNEADYGQGKVYGTWLLKNDKSVFRDISATELVNPQTSEDRFRAVNLYASKNGFSGAFPTFFEAIVCGTWLLKNDKAEFRDVSAAELGSPQTSEDRFRAVNLYASKNGFSGAFPTFYEAIVCGTWLLKKDKAEFRDISATELGNPQTSEDRFRAVNLYASKNGFSGAFPTFYEAKYGSGKVCGTWLLKKDAAEFRDISATELGNPQTSEDRFRAANLYAFKNGFSGAFPTFNEANYGNGKVYGVWLIKKDAAEFRDVSTIELGNPQTYEDRFRAANIYATNHGFSGAFPTFHQAKVCGTWLLKKDAAEFRDISATELGNPQTSEDRFRAANLYAFKNGFSGAFPTFNEANYGNGKVYGVWLIKKDAAEFRDIPFYSLLKQLIRPGDIIYGWEVNPGHVGIIVEDNGDLVVREAYPEKGVANISLKDFCDCGGYHKELGYFPNYSEVGIFRVGCSNEQAHKAADIAKANSGYYDWTYLEAGIGMIACGTVGLITAIPTLGISLIVSTIGAAAESEVWRTAWDDNGLWYCSKLIYKSYYRAGYDLYPKTGTCLNPLTAYRVGEYPYLFDGRCPWWLITPTQVCTAKSVHLIWTWKR